MEQREGRSSGRWKLVSTALVLLIPVVAALELRVRSAGVPTTRELAARVAQGEAQAQAMRTVAARGLSGTRFVQQGLSQLDSLLRAPAYRARVRELTGLAEEFYRDAQGTPYLQGTDPYRWLRRARNVAERGNAGESVRDGRPWNDLTGVPQGIPADTNAQAVAVGIATRLLRPLGAPSLEKIDYWSPVALACIAVALAGLVGLQLAGPWGGLLSGALLALQPFVAQRTNAGYADTDSWNLVFALAIVWLLGESLAARRMRRASVHAALAALGAGIFAWSWPGWWFVFASLLAGLCGGIVLERLGPLVARRPSARRAPAPSRRRDAAASSADPAPEATAGPLAFRGAVFVAASIASILVIGGASRLAGFWREPAAALGMHASTIGGVWPNVYESVGELQPVSFDRILRGLGGGVVAGLSLVGLYFLVSGALRIRALAFPAILAAGLVAVAARILPAKGVAILIAGAGLAGLGGIVVGLRSGRRVQVVPLGLVAWTLAALVACTRGNRFVLLLAPPVAIAAGSSLGHVVARVVDTARRTGSQATRVWSLAGTGVALVALLGVVHRQAHRTLSGTVRLPAMNDAWAASFDWLRAQSDPHAVVCAWWDYGDMVTALARRRVLHDAELLAQSGLAHDGGSQLTSITYWIARVLAAEDPDEARAVLKLLCTGGQGGYDTLREAGLTPQRAVPLLVEMARLAPDVAVEKARAAGVPEDAARRVEEPLRAAPPEAYLWLTEDLTSKASIWSRYGRWDFDKAAPREPPFDMRAASICSPALGGIVTSNGALLDLPSPDWTGVLPRPRGAAVAIYRRSDLAWIVPLPPPVAPSLYVRLMYGSPRGVGPFELAWDGQTFLGERVAVYRIRW